MNAQPTAMTLSSGWMATPRAGSVEPPGLITAMTSPSPAEDA
jgi:hypothetical protein